MRNHASVLAPVVTRILGRGDIGESPLTRIEEHRIVAAHLHIPVDQVFSLRQVHSDQIVHIRAGHTPPGTDNLPEADALVTDVPGTCLLIRTADCLPVLVSARAKNSDGVHHVIGAAHAGWRGLAAGIVEKTTQAVRALLPPNPAEIQFRVDLGPAISGGVYEVGPEVAEHFSRKTKAPAPGKYLVDLAASAVLAVAAGLCLEDAGRAPLMSAWDHGDQEPSVYTEWDGTPVQVTVSRSLSACTVLNHSDYFSHRKGDTGRNLNAILLTKETFHG